YKRDYCGEDRAHMFLFQSLIGNLQTSFGLPINHLLLLFQSLIGNLQTPEKARQIHHLHIYTITLGNNYVNWENGCFPSFTWLLEIWKKMKVSSTSRGFCIIGGRRHLKLS